MMKLVIGQKRKVSPLSFQADDKNETGKYQQKQGLVDQARHAALQGVVREKDKVIASYANLAANLKRENEDLRYKHESNEYWF